MMTRRYSITVVRARLCVCVCMHLYVFSSDSLFRSRSLLFPLVQPFRFLRLVYQCDNKQQQYQKQKKEKKKIKQQHGNLFLYFKFVCIRLCVISLNCFCYSNLPHSQIVQRFSFQAPLSLSCALKIRQSFAIRNPIVIVVVVVIIVIIVSGTVSVHPTWAWLLCVCVREIEWKRGKNSTIVHLEKVKTCGQYIITAVVAEILLYGIRNAHTHIYENIYGKKM